MICKRYAVLQDGNFSTRAEDGNLYIEGYFAVYNSRYELWDEAYETIDRGAFDGETDGDVRALTNHDTTLVLGRTTAGTLTLKADERGLWGSITINQADQDALNLYERVKRGDVSQCSFGFDILEQDIEYKDGEPPCGISARSNCMRCQWSLFPRMRTPAYRPEERSLTISKKENQNSGGKQ